jgi:hypothetical protein
MKSSRFGQHQQSDRSTHPAGGSAERIQKRMGESQKAPEMGG